MNQYREYIKDLAKNDKNVVFNNSGPEHAALVMSTIFETAKKRIRILAGSFSGEISKNDEYRRTLEKFLSHGGNVQVLLDKKKFDSLEKEPKIFDILRFYSIVNPEQVSIRKYNTPVVRSEKGASDVHEVHFTVADDKMYRVEDNIDTFVAFGNFNDEKTAKSLNTIFDNIFTVSEPISLNKPYHKN